MAVFEGIILFAHSHALAAAFGVSPPWIENENLKPGSNFIYVINLSANELPADMKVKAEIQGDPEVQEWLNVSNPDSLVMTKGKSMVPMSVSLNVPADAKVGKYEGRLNVSLTSENPVAENVAILLGGNIKVNLTVIDHDVTDYWVQSISADPINVDEAIELQMSLKNLGNTELSKVMTKVSVIDKKTGEALVSGSVDSLSTSVYPHTMAIVKLSFPAPGLEVGSYWLDVEALKEGESVYDTRLNLIVEPSLVSGSVSTGVNVTQDGQELRSAAPAEKGNSATVATSVKVRAPLTNQLIVVVIAMLVVLTGIVAKIYTTIKKKRR